MFYFKNFIAKWNRNNHTLIVFLIILIATRYYVSLIFCKRSKIWQHYPENHLSSSEAAKISILDWTGFGHQPFYHKRYFKHCPDAICLLTNDRLSLPRAHAIIFHAGDSCPWDLPAMRFDWQRYVFMNHEAPTYTSRYSSQYPPDFFNWTMTYRSDSDIYYPYEEYIMLGKKYRRLNANFMHNKTKLVAWFVSHCETSSRREMIVQELSKYVAVDVFGKCGTKTCPRNDWTACNSMLEKQYKFYLAFENSICKDYITEKFWDKLTLNIVPIVLKRRVYDGWLPSDAFIAVDDFPDLRTLAVFLLNLHENVDKYLKYFAWKGKPWKPRVQLSEIGFCKLCQKLQWAANASLQSRKSYPNAHKWFVSGSHCDEEFAFRQTG